jgi:hypothetical protein
MTKGVLLFAHNNGLIDYVSQAIFCCEQIKQHLNIPVSLVTSNKVPPDKVSLFDKIIPIENSNTNQTKSFLDGSTNRYSALWHNFSRPDCYDLTPYDETIVMDSDYIVGNDNLLKCFQSNADFLINKDAEYINYQHRDDLLDTDVSDSSIPMYWATVFYFKKTEKMKTFFDLIKHIKNNWSFYRFTYQIVGENYRNDHSFSIAIHMFNDFKETNWPMKLPSKLYYITDRDDVHYFNGDWELKLSVDTKKYYPCKVSGMNLHIMNKLALNRAIVYDRWIKEGQYDKK